MLRLHFLQSQPEFLSRASVFPFINWVTHWFEICGCHVCVKVISVIILMFISGFKGCHLPPAFAWKFLAVQIWGSWCLFLRSYFLPAMGLYGFEAHRWSPRSSRKRILWCPAHTRAEEHRLLDWGTHSSPL